MTRPLVSWSLPHDVILNTIAARPVVSWPFESDGKTATLRELQVTGWRAHDFPALLFGADVDWALPGQTHRTWGFRLHAWDFMGGTLSRGAEEEPDSLLECVRLALSWGNFSRSVAADGSMAWYDMALSRRVVRLTQLVRLAAVAPNIKPGDLESLLDLLAVQLARLGDDDMFADHNNHGVYAAMASLFFSAQAQGIDEAEVQGELGFRRLGVVLHTQFLTDGGHAEHSPEYHQMLLEVLVQSQAAGLPIGPEVVKLLDRARTVESWYVQPNGLFVQFGDTSARTRRPLPPPPDSTRAESSVIRDLQVLDETGVAIARRFVRRGDDCQFVEHFALQAAFHSRVHKHADDLSVTWFAGDEEVLVDGGKYGYGTQVSARSPLRREGFFYTEVPRQYVETTMAHNTVGLGDGSHDRVRRQPYGSAIKGYRSTANADVVWATVNHDTWRHRRIVGLGSQNLLVVLDHIDEIEPTGKRFSAWWNVSEAWVVAAVKEGDASAGLLLRSNAKGALRIRQHAPACKLDWVKGQEHPMRGWRSVVDRTLEPVNSIRYSSMTSGVAFVTSFSINETRSLRRARDVIVKELRNTNQALVAGELSEDGFPSGTVR